VDFSGAMIFLTSNLGATEMGAILRPSVGFATSETERRQAEGEADEALYQKLSRTEVFTKRVEISVENGYLSNMHSL
jgi:hypothetical protein